MKIILIRWLQLLLGYERYLYLFARFTIATLKWNRRERDFLQFIKLLPDHGIVMDVGANIGVMTVHLSRRLKNARIYSFEPISFNINTLKKVTSHYSAANVSIFEKALGNKSGEFDMLMPVVNHVKRHGLGHIIQGGSPAGSVGEVHKVAVEVADHIAALNGELPVTGIKLDVENFEYHVLEGARALIGRCRPVIYSELWDNENRTKCFELLCGMGYQVKVSDGRALVPFDPQKHRTQNFFFIP